MAKDFSVSVPHSLSRTTAQHRIDLLVSQARTVLADPSDHEQVHWEDDRCHFRLKVGLFPLSGIIVVGRSSVDVTGRLPWGAGRYAKRVEAVVAERLAALLTGGRGPAGPTGGDEPPDYPPLRSV